MAVGVIHLSYDDFCRLSPLEFSSIYEAWKERVESEDRAEWERMRMLATITIQPHVKGRMRPEKLLPFPWEKPKVVKGERLTLEERKKIMEKLAKS